MKPGIRKDKKRTPSREVQQRTRRQRHGQERGTRVIRVVGIRKMWTELIQAKDIQTQGAIQNRELGRRRSTRTNWSGITKEKNSKLKLAHLQILGQEFGLRVNVQQWGERGTTR